jgi:hypothetical protein
MARVIALQAPRASDRIPGNETPAPAAPPGGDVYVVFTTIDQTLRAVRVARRLADAMGSGVTVVHFQSVDFGAPLEDPVGISPVETDDFTSRLEAEGAPIRVRVWVCRDARRAISLALGAHALVVVGGRRRWWPTRSGRWQRRLEAQGHFVVFVDEAVHA